MHPTPSTQDADVLRSNLQRPPARLRFTPALEQSFLEHLRALQQWAALFTLCTVTVIWLVYTGIDYWRLQALQGSAYESAFFWRSWILRWPVLLCFLCALYALLRKTMPLRSYEVAVAGSLLTCSMAIITSSNTLVNAGMPNTSVIMVLMVSVALFPLGVRWRVSGPVALVICCLITLAGPLMLENARDLVQHWVLSVVVWLAFILTVVPAYLREQGLREQFLLRSLLHWDATHDPLTGLANRRKFREHFDQCMRQARRNADPLFLVVLDIDYFKLYNDHYGHVAGDNALREVSKLLQQLAQRPLDLAVRLGGEEFGLVIYGMQPVMLAEHLAKLQKALACRNLEHRASPIARQVTVSMGAVRVHSEDTEDSALQSADRLLYQAKSQGRNQFCIQPSVEAMAECDDDLPNATPKSAPTA